MIVTKPAVVKNPMRMRFHYKQVLACIEDLEIKQARINDALRQLRPLVGLPDLPDDWDGVDRRENARD